MHIATHYVSKVAIVALLALAAGTPVAGADEVQANTPSNRDLEVGIGVVCNTKEQVARFSHLSDESGNVRQAISIVNTEANSQTACAAIAAAFVRGKNVGEVQRKDGPVNIAEITIVAVPAGNQWQFVSPVKQYTAFKVKGISI